MCSQVVLIKGTSPDEDFLRMARLNIIRSSPSALTAAHSKRFVVSHPSLMNRWRLRVGQAMAPLLVTGAGSFAMAAAVASRGQVRSPACADTFDAWGTAVPVRRIRKQWETYGTRI